MIQCLFHSSLMSLMTKDAFQLLLELLIARWTYLTEKENKIVRLIYILSYSIDHDISDTVLHMMDIAAKIQNLDFNEDQIDGGVEGVMVETDQDMVVACCYIAECITLNKEIDLDTFDPDYERQKIVDTFLTLLSF